MNTTEVDERISVQASSVSKDTILHYVVLAVAALYVIVSLYLIFEARSRLTSAVNAQDGQLKDCGSVKLRQKRISRRPTRP